MILLGAVFLLTGCRTKNPPSENTGNCDETVTNYRLNYNVTYTGGLRNGKPHGEGVFKYRNNDSLKTCLKEGKVDPSCESTLTIGTSRDKFIGKLILDEEYRYQLIEGTYDYAVGSLIYEGKFNENLFEDEEGKLTLSEDSYYIGQFRQGTNIGLKGRIYYAAYENQTEGLWYYEGTMKTEKTFVANQLGYGKILFGDDSTYTGQLFYDGSSFLRKGKGEMDFANCHFLAGPWGASNEEYIARYVGEFDYSVSQWIYGNGVMYYTDKEGNPTSWAKGFFSANNLIGRYEGEEIDLAEGYTESMEKPYLRFREDYDVYLAEEKYAPQHHDILFIGDSYMEFMNSQSNTPFEKYFGEYDALNVGCGGSTTADWLNYYRDLILPYSPEVIVLHLGGNDYTQYSTFERIDANLRELISMCKADFPDVKIYIVDQWMTVATRSTYNARYQLNLIYDKIESEISGVEVIKVSDLVLQDELHWIPVDDLASYFGNDGHHMNDKGYLLWSERIKEYLNGGAEK